MNQLISLAEYGTASVKLPEAVASDLALAAKNRLRVSVDGIPGLYRVEATQYVGSVVVPGLSVLVRPKVPLENVFLLLDAVVEPEWRAEQFGWDVTSGLLPAFAAFFARTLERTLSRGLYQSYQAKEEWVPALRGRFDLVEQLRRPGIQVPVPCRYDEFTVDVLENQLLKAALIRLSRTPGISSEIHRRIRRLRSLFEEVTDTIPDPSSTDRIHFHRLNERYRPALRLAELVLRDLTLVDRAGLRVASSFLIDMNVLFQDFVTLRLRRILRDHIQVESEPSVHLAHGRKVRMRPDLIFTRQGEPVLVGDTKYKLIGDQLGRDSDYYQLLAYTTGMDLPTGVLIYCTSDGIVPDRAIDVLHCGKRLWTYPLDLSGSPTAVGENITALGVWISQHALTSIAAVS